ncbi:13497_t:CDS:2, partial [Racocetra fulgida]
IYDIGNISLDRHNKIDAKILLGYIPSLDYCSTSKKKTAQFRLAAQKLFHKALATILRPLRSLSNNGIHLYVNDCDAMNNVHLEKENINIRNENTTKDFLQWSKGNGKQISLHHIKNALWKHP